MVLSSQKNLYEILEVEFSASATMIKSAYRRLARKYHPDLNSGDAACEKKFKEVTHAYEILSDEEKKKNYDLLKGFHQETSQAKYSEANKAYKKTSSETDKSKTRSDSFSNIFNDILDGFKNTTSSKKSETFKTKQMKPERGGDVHADVVITMEEALSGTSRTVNILHTETCPNCENRTFLNGSKCNVCNGLGEHSIHKKLRVKIPANVKHGSKIRIANEGNKGYNGGRNGDLFLNVKIESDANFKYDGINILGEVKIAPYEAVLGASIELQTPTGKVNMKVTPNTHCGQKFRLSGQGLEQHGKKGDMIITVNIEIPKDLSSEEIELYKKLRDISKGNVRQDE